MIKQGAKLVENADDILEEFDFFKKPIQGRDVPGEASDRSPEMDEPERKIYELIGAYPMHIDRIVRMTDLDAGEISSILMQMELKGIVKQLPGKMFVR